MPFMRRTIFALCLGSVLLGLAASRAARADAVLTIGSVAPDAAEEMSEWLPFARYLAAQLVDAGITGGKIVVAPTANAMAERLRGGQVDLYIDSPLIAMQVNEAAGSKMLLRRWKDGRADYTSVIVARRDSGITSLRQLAGKVVAFQSEYSSSGYLLPRLVIAREGLGLVPLQGLRAAAPADKVGYVFSEKDENTLAWVLRGQVAAGGTARSDFEKRLPPASRDELIVLDESPVIPRHVVNARGDLPAALAARIREALLAMDRTEAGRQAMLSFEGTTRFDDMPADALAALAALAPLLRSQRP